MADKFRSLGGELREGNRWQESVQREGVVQASGRRPQTKPEGWRWFGVKAHTKNVTLSADLEVQLAPIGYVGLCRLADGVVNVCGLFRRRGDEGALALRTDLLRGTPGSALQERLAAAEFLPEFSCTVGGLDLRPRSAHGTPECRIGDALTMIPPFTGNGMSMAFESAKFALEPLERWNCGKSSWAETVQTVAFRCNEGFRNRLAWANRLHKLMFVNPLQPAIVRWLPGSKRSWNLLFSNTR